MSEINKIRLTECPRDAMQGLSHFIPTDQKVMYLNALLKVGFDILDFGSFVSPKAIPQLSDTRDVIPQLELHSGSPELLSIVANLRGAKDAAEFDEVSYLGFPFSISNTFLKRNINSTVEKAFGLCNELLELCDKKNKKLMIYLSMAFGNNYSDPWSVDLLANWVYTLKRSGAREINLSDTIGIASAQKVRKVFSLLSKEFRDIELGFHLHSHQRGWKAKIEAAYENGCRNFDGVLSGKGGCPMTGEDMVGNIAMEKLILFFAEKGIDLGLNQEALDESLQWAKQLLK